MSDIKKELYQLLLEGKLDGEDENNFKKRFQSFLNQMPKSTDATSAPAREGFFPGYFLGMFSSLKNVKGASEYGIKDIYFKFDGNNVLHVVVDKQAGHGKPMIFVFSVNDNTNLQDYKDQYGELLNTADSLNLVSISRDDDSKLKVLTQKEEGRSGTSRGFKDKLKEQGFIELPKLLSYGNLDDIMKGIGSGSQKKLEDLLEYYTTLYQEISYSVGEISLLGKRDRRNNK